MKNNKISNIAFFALLATGINFPAQAMLKSEKDLQEEIKQKGDCGKAPIHLAAGFDNLSDLKTLVGRKADIEAKDEKGVTPLMTASLNGCVVAARYLLSQRAQVNYETQEGSALKYALSDGHANVAKTLLDAKATISREGVERRLQKLAGSHGRHANVKRLLETVLENLNSESQVPTLDVEWDAQEDDGSWENWQDEQTVIESKDSDGQEEEKKD